MPQTLPRTDATVPRSDVAPPPFTCAWSDGGFGAAWVHLAGELDLAASPELVRTLGEALVHAHVVVVDLRGLAFMDTAGVHILADASARARGDDRRVIVVRGQAEVARILTLTGAADEVEIFDLDPAHPPVQVLLQLAGRDCRSS